MKHLFVCLAWLLSSSIAAEPAAAQATRPPAAQSAAPPSQAYMKLASECCQLLRQAAALPDAQGVALLQQRVPPLQGRARPVTAAYARWLKALPPAQQAAEEERIMHSGFAKELEAAVAAIGPQAKHSRAFIQQVSILMESMAQGL